MLGAHEVSPSSDAYGCRWLRQSQSPDSRRQHCLCSRRALEAHQPQLAYPPLHETGHIYGVSVDTLRRRIAEGALPAVKSGYKLIRVRIADLDRVFRPMPTVDPNEFRYRW